MKKESRLFDKIDIFFILSDNAFVVFNFFRNFPYRKTSRLPNPDP